jgi:hypothetical protein
MSVIRRLVNVAYFRVRQALDGDAPDPERSAALDAELGAARPRPVPEREAEPRGGPGDEAPAPAEAPAPRPRRL